MRRTHLDPLFGFHSDPPYRGAAARKHQRVLAVLVDDGQLKVAIEWRGRYRVPLHTEMLCREWPDAFDLGQGIAARACRAT